MKKYLRDGLFLLGLAAGIFLLNKLTGPISFLLICTIALSLIFYLANFRKDTGHGRSLGPLQAQNVARQLSRTKTMSILFVFIVFCVAVKVLYSYQRPTGDDPYFFNTQHHAIKNTGIAFREVITLYSDTSEQQNGLWDADNGQVDLIINNGSPELSGKQFFIPIFSKGPIGGDTLLNPQFPTCLQSGDYLEEEENKLSILAIKPLRNWLGKSTGRFDLTLLFTSRDSSVVFSSKKEVSDTIFLKNIALARGMELKSLLYAQESSMESATGANLIRWLFPRNIWLLRNPASVREEDRNGLHLFFSPSDFSSNTRLQVGGQTYTSGSLSLLTKIPLHIDQPFYIGLEKRQRSLRVGTTKGLSWFSKGTQGDLAYALYFDQVAYRSISDIEDNTQKLGADNVLYLLNNLDGVSSQGQNKLREGILFHEDLKVNKLTDLGDSYLKFKNDLPGTKLTVEVWTEPKNLIRDEGSSVRKNFAIQTADQRYAWLYDIWNLDAEGNGYTFPRQVIYLTILFIAIVSLLYFAPSLTLLSVETPFWMILYSLVVFRLLLLWRIATFPPLQGVNAHELNKTLRGFDMSLPGIGSIPIPFSVLLVLILVGCIYLVRIGRFNQWIKLWNSKISVKKLRIAPNSVILHLAVLFLAGVASQLFTMEFLNRLLKIVAPVISYFYFYYWSIRNEPDYSYDWLRTTRGRAPILQDLFKLLVRSNRFFLSLSTLAYLFVTDRGFGVIFLIFLILQGALLSLTSGTSSRQQERLRKLRIGLGYLILLIFYLLISFKNLIYYLIEYKRLAFGLIIIISMLGVFYLAKAQAVWKKPVLIVFALILVIISLPWTWSPINQLIDKEISSVRHRASILNMPLKDIIKSTAYRSGAERKIIETAQNQWFIHSYLNQDPIRNNGINLQPHFKKGVDFSTQTRDVVLPRFVIAEFGSFPMALLLILMALPLSMYLLRYKIFSNGRLNADSLLTSISLLLLFSISIIVWLSATNRFVFFGQDFPFISLTSRVSLFIPLVIFFIAQTRNPYSQGVTADDLTINTRRWLLFLGITAIIITIAGRTQKINNENFSLDLNDFASKFENKINTLLLVEQSKEGEGLKKILESKDLTYQHVSKWLNTILTDAEISKEIKDLSVYERSILELIAKNPSRGFDLRSPVHFIEQGNSLSMEMNRYYQFELPAYSRAKAWKGDILSSDQNLTKDLTTTGIVGVDMILLGKSQLGVDSVPVAVVWPDVSQGNYYILKRVKNGQKELNSYARSDGPQIVREGDLLVYRPNASSSFKTWSLTGTTRRYFAINMTINGVQRMVYPLGKASPWIREWTLLQKRIRESGTSENLYESGEIHLDHDLNREIGNYMNKNIPADIPKNNNRRVIFSVIAADGEGRIRLLSDYARGRTILNPNDENAYEEKLKMEYFERNNEMSRVQWGNWNLLHMKDGPGSSIKPLVLSAIASQKKLNWNDLGVEGSDSTVNKYAGHQISSSNWKSDVRSAENPVDYLARSVNRFHTMIYFLGSYTYDELKSYTNFNQFLPKAKSKDDYPKIKINKVGGYTLPYQNDKPLGWPAPPSSSLPFHYFTNTESLVGNGLKSLYGLQLGSASSSGTLTGHNEQFTRENIQRPYLPTTWSTPERCFFNMQECAGTDLTSNLYNGIRFPALGGGVFRLTPYELINYYGRLFNYDRNFSASIDSKTANPEEAVRIDPAWGGPAGFISRFLEPLTFTGMAKAVKSGTADFLVTVGSAQYDLYAKTGTTGTSNDDNSKRLIVVVMKKGDPAPIQQRKKYFLYFTVQNAHENGGDDKWFKKHYKYIIEKVLASETFKSYMN
jgi:hypothetical protein